MKSDRINSIAIILIGLSTILGNTAIIMMKFDFNERIHDYLCSRGIETAPALWSAKDVPLNCAKFHFESQR